MSDDTPTGRFDQGSGDEPTRRLPQQPDDAPTERFTPPADDSPTERFAPPAAERPAERLPPPVVPPTREPARIADASNAPRIALIIIGSLLVAAIAVLLLVLATRGNESTPTPDAPPTAAPQPSETPQEEPAREEPAPVETEPAPEPEPEPEPAPEQGATFTSFKPEDASTVDCPDDAASVPLTFSWTSTGAESAWIGVGTEDAKADPYAEVDPNDTFTDISYDCGVESELYTVTLDDGVGTLANATVTLVRQLP